MLPVTIGSIFLALAVLIVVALFLVRPFFTAQPQDEIVSQRQELLIRKEALLDAIRAADFDHDTGRLPDEEYEQQREVLMKEAASTLKALDGLPADPASDDIYAQIEAAINAIRSQRSQAGGAASHFCTNCGHKLDGDDKFCASCGQPVFVAQPSL